MADLLCQSSDPLGDEQLTLQQRFQALQNLTRLCSLCEVLQRSSTPSDNLSSDAEGGKDAFCKYPITCLDTQYLFCLGNTILCHATRTFSFSCRDTLKKHVEKVHLHHLSPDSEFTCVHPACDQKVNGLMHFKNHAATVHKVFL